MVNARDHVARPFAKWSGRGDSYMQAGRRLTFAEDGNLEGYRIFVAHAGQKED